MNEIHDAARQLRRPEHQYEKVLELLEKVRADTRKYIALEIGFYSHITAPEIALYLEDGWPSGVSYMPLGTLDKAVDFLESFLERRAGRGLLFKKF